MRRQELYARLEAQSAQREADAQSTKIKAEFELGAPLRRSQQKIEEGRKDLYRRIVARQVRRETIRKMQEIRDAPRRGPFLPSPLPPPPSQAEQQRAAHEKMLQEAERRAKAQRMAYIQELRDAPRRGPFFP
ncbi:hypothetical protein K438DRAFT_1992420 [Mycena galopus ATCC 62051]|nr:hypothetical protein K438DRAFT_1992420 [Mycena galopus ATCC 62051]